MSYGQQRVLAIAVAVMLGVVGAIQLKSPADLGLPPVVAEWLVIVSVGLGILAGFLPSVRGMGNDPTFLLHRIQELPVHEQQALATALATDAESALISKPPEWLPEERR